MKYPGLIIPSHRVIDAKSKEIAQDRRTLSKWQAVELTAEEWIAKLDAGHIIQPSTYKPKETGSYTHAKEYWIDTYFICADGDNLRNVEFYESEENKGQDKNPNGLEPWTEPGQLSIMFPDLLEKAYAVGESISSMLKEPLHRRFRLVFLFDQPITNERHYNHILEQLTDEFPIISKVSRAPTQPVFGNGREGFNFHICGNILRLEDYPIPEEPPKTYTQQQTFDSDERLDEFLRRHNIPYTETKTPDKFYVDCPYKDGHTGGKQGPTDSYVFDDGTGTGWAFYCSHAHCANKRTWQAFKDGNGIKNGNGNYQAKTTKKNSNPESPEDTEESPIFFNKSKFIPMGMIDYLADEYDFLSLPTEKGIRYYSKGVYKLDTGSRIQRSIHEALCYAVKQTHVTETLALLKDRYMTELPPDGDMPCLHPNYINVKNGFIDARTGEFTSHKKTNIKSLIQLPVKYDPKAKCPKIDAFLSDILKESEADIKLAHEIIGYSMLQQVPLGKMVILLGPTHTGKSTFLKLITNFLGATNVSGISLQALDDENLRFSRSGLYGKLANICGDLSRKALAGDSKIKEITAGDRLSVERKGIDEFLMRPFATLICAANEMPTSRDKSEAWIERLIILPFNKQHTGTAAKRNYIDELTTKSELSGLLNHAIKAVKDLISAGVFTSTEQTQAAAESYRLNNDNVIRFLSENYEQKVTEDRIAEITLYESYCKWCEREGIRPTNKNNVRKTVAKWLGVNNPTRELLSDGKRQFVWKDISYINEELSENDTYSINL